MSGPMAPAQQWSARDVDLEFDSEEGAPFVGPPPRPWNWKKATGVVATAALLTAAAAVAYRSLAGGPVDSVHGVQDAVGLEMMPYAPPRQACSNVSANCLPTGCCKVSGMTCFKTNGVGKCMKKCDGCESVAPPQVPVQSWPGLSFFCFSVYTNNTGSTKKSHELELIKQQKAKGVSIFRCAEQAVYSDVVASIAPGLTTIKVEDAKGDWHFAKRKTSGSWINTGMFVQIWKKIAEGGMWARHNYVIKADADAVFFPNKLFEKLRGKGVPAEGVYYENCKFVDYGYFGSLEVYSQAAFGTLLKFLDQCYSELPWKVGVQGGKYGPMGEDLFAQKCMDLHGVKKVDDFTLVLDGTCPADRPDDKKKDKKYIPPCKGSAHAAIHPYKKPAAWAACMQEADQTYPA